MTLSARPMGSPKRAHAAWATPKGAGNCNPLQPSQSADLHPFSCILADSPKRATARMPAYTLESPVKRAGNAASSNGPSSTPQVRIPYAPHELSYSLLSTARVARSPAWPSCPSPAPVLLNRPPGIAGELSHGLSSHSCQRRFRQTRLRVTAQGFGLPSIASF